MVEKTKINWEKFKVEPKKERCLACQGYGINYNKLGDPARSAIVQTCLWCSGSGWIIR